MQYDVYLLCENGRRANLILLGGTPEQVARKVKNLLQDNEGGVAQVEAVYGNFQTIVEA